MKTHALVLILCLATPVYAQVAVHDPKTDEILARAAKRKADQEAKDAKIAKDANGKDPNAAKDPCHPCASVMNRSGTGAGVCRSDPPGWCDDCAKRGQYLQDAYAKVIAAYKPAEAKAKTDPNHDQAVLDNLRGQIRYLRNEWKITREHCPALTPLYDPNPDDAGAGGGGGGAAPAGGSGGGGGGGGGSSGGGGGGPTAGAPQGPIGGKAVIYGMIKGRLLLAPGNGRLNGVKHLPTLIAKDRGSLERLAESLHQAERGDGAIERSDIDKIAAAAPLTVPIPTDAPDAVRAGLEAVAAREREIADLDAFAMSQGRFLGAERKKDTTAMLAQAGVMVKLIDDALVAARTAAGKQIDAERLLAAALDQLRRDVQTQPGGWSEALPTLNWPSQRDMPAEILSELAAAGANRYDIEALRAAAHDADAEDADLAITDLVAATTNTDAARTAAASRDVWTPAATPPDYYALVGARETAVDMNTRAGAKPGVAGAAPPRKNPIQKWWLFPFLAVTSLVGYGVFLKRASPPVKRG